MYCNFLLQLNMANRRHLFFSAFVLKLYLFSEQLENSMK